LEVAPLARKVFAGHWTWKSRIRMFCWHFVNIWSSTLRFRQHLHHFGVRTSHLRCFATYVGLKFMVGLGLIEAWFGVYLKLVLNLIRLTWDYLGLVSG
jgi:hypothetical protein